MIINMKEAEKTSTQTLFRKIFRTQIFALKIWWFLLNIFEGPVKYKHNGFQLITGPYIHIWISSNFVRTGNYKSIGPELTQFPSIRIPLTYILNYLPLYM